MRIALCALSNPVPAYVADELAASLRQAGIRCSTAFFQKDLSAPRKKAQAFNELVREDYDWIFDISGGDLANLVLPYLDYAAYARARTVLAGYSDLTCVLNALLSRSQRPALLFQIAAHAPFGEVVSFLKEGTSDTLFYLTDKPVVGGNVRCFLKLAGTPYLPSAAGKILFLESHSGKPERLASYFAQLAQMGLFAQADAVYTGEFTELYRLYGPANADRQIASLLEGIGIPVKTGVPVGHAAGSRALWLGKESH